MITKEGVTTFVNNRGNLVERVFCPSERYAFDFTMCQLGWKQYDTDQDAWYFGIWYHPGKRQTVTYAEGDVTLVTCEDWEHFIAEMKDADRFYGNAPITTIVGDGIGIDGKLTNAYGLIDENARLNYEIEKPEKEEPITIDQVLYVFLQVEV